MKRIALILALFSLPAHGDVCATFDSYGDMITGQYLGGSSVYVSRHWTLAGGVEIVDCAQAVKGNPFHQPVALSFNNRTRMILWSDIIAGEGVK